MKKVLITKKQHLSGIDIDIKVAQTPFFPTDD